VIPFDHSVIYPPFPLSPPTKNKHHTTNMRFPRATRTTLAVLLVLSTITAFQSPSTTVQLLLSRNRKPLRHSVGHGRTAASSSSSLVLLYASTLERADDVTTTTKKKNGNEQQSLGDRFAASTMASAAAVAAAAGMWVAYDSFHHSTVATAQYCSYSITPPTALSPSHAHTYYCTLLFLFVLLLLTILLQSTRPCR
jgi:hypothetical protein